MNTFPAVWFGLTPIPSVAEGGMNTLTNLAQSGKKEVKLVKKGTDHL